MQFAFCVCYSGCLYLFFLFCSRLCCCRFCLRYWRFLHFLLICGVCSRRRERGWGWENQESEVKECKQEEEEEGGQLEGTGGGGTEEEEGEQEKEK